MSSCDITPCDSYLPHLGICDVSAVGTLPGGVIQASDCSGTWSVSSYTNVCTYVEEKVERWLKCVIKECSTTDEEEAIFETQCRTLAESFQLPPNCDIQCGELASSFVAFLVVGTILTLVACLCLFQYHWRSVKDKKNEPIGTRPSNDWLHMPFAAPPSKKIPKI